MRGKIKRGVLSSSPLFLNSIAMNELYEIYDQEYYEDLQNELALDEYLMDKAEAKKEWTFEEREEIQRENE